MKKILALLLALAMLLSFTACGGDQSSIGIIGGADGPTAIFVTGPEGEASELDPDGWYYSPEEVALYLYLYGCLPDNFITKEEARDLGWDSSAGNLWEVADGMSIGGDRFGNREGLLPSAQDRTWYECDVNYAGGYRGSERVLWSNDGLIYYTNDHYNSFVELV